MNRCPECDRLWRDYTDARDSLCALLKATNPAVPETAAVREQYALLRSTLRTHIVQCPISATEAGSSASTGSPNAATAGWRNVPLDLNRANANEIATLPMMSGERAEKIVQYRPYRSWRDLLRVPGFTSEIIAALMRSGATLGQ